ncbi:ComEC/Rec2 family competence protein [Croceibacter atlanticus]|uniref:ComEC/Rec2 family competence protein n=1 Tax=Croceibacter atlanticus TaxID=313588 RepID=UPI0032B2BD9D
MKVLNFSIIKLTLAIIAGILIAYTFTISFKLVITLLCSTVLVFTILFIKSKRSKKQDALFGVAALFLFVCIGMFSWEINQPKNNPNHFTNSISYENPLTLKGHVSEQLKPYGNLENYIFNIERINNKPITGKILLKVRIEDSLKPTYNIGEYLAFKSTLSKVTEPKNPYQFNYAKYLEHQNILAQVSISNREIFQFSEVKISMYSIANTLRNNIEIALIDNGFKGDELAVIKALLLGQKKDISKDMYDDYASAGVIHILAVSGLHVGIILMLLQLILSTFFRFKHGNVFKTVLIVLFLWCFAIIAGLSPSVIRAVTMFSFLAVALNLKRKTSTLNTLFLSALVILLVQPQFLFSVGFQLSYLAVFSIILLQPKLSKLIPRPKYYISRILWGVFTVTIAAQIGVLPLSLFYFHQFPGLFFVTNLIIIPFLGIILGYGLLCISLALLGILPSFIAEGFRLVIGFMNSVISWVAQQNSFVFKEIPFSEIQTIVTYVLIGTILISIQRFKTKNFIYILCAVVIFQLGFMYESYTAKTTEEFVVFQQTAQTVIGLKKGEHFEVSLKDSSSSSFTRQLVSNYIVGSHLDSVSTVPLKNVYQFKGNRIYVIDSLGVYSSDFSNATIILSNSPKINLNRLIDSISPQRIIADGNNYKSYVKRWKATAKHKKLPFHPTGEKGAFLIKD